VLSKRKKRQPEVGKAPTYRQSAREKAALDQYVAQVAAAPAVPRTKVPKAKSCQMSGRITPASLWHGLRCLI
jgi:hypothetical protein